MMLTYRKAHTVIKSAVFSLACLVFLASCQEDQLNEVSEEATTAAMANVESNIESLTITGTNAVFADAIDCNTCAYVVPANEVTIDGKALGLKPGSVICLDAASKYGNLEFVNLDGTEKDPITVGVCK